VDRGGCEVYNKYSRFVIDMDDTGYEGTDSFRCGAG
jgi:hypothetical protein